VLAPTQRPKIVVGDALAINAYDEYGRPAAANQGRFQYTGQTWLAEASLYHYKARAYSPVLGRFMQTDPILYAGGMNLYEYVGSDPVNRLDPLGLLCRMLVSVRVRFPDGSPDAVQSYWLEVPCNSMAAITSGSGLGRPTRSGDAGGADGLDRGEVDPNVWVPYLSVSTTNDALLDACGAAGASGLGALFAMELGPAGGFVGSELGGPIGQSICGMARQSARRAASGWDVFWANFFDFAQPGGGPFPINPLAPRE